MTKDEAIKLLGGTPSAAAKAIGVSRQAVDNWPDELSRRISDRVIAATFRLSMMPSNVYSACTSQKRGLKNV